MPGRVVNRADLLIETRRYDLLVLGGGLLGLAAAFYLRRLAPGLSLAVIEQDGVPSEAGATWAAPGVWHGVYHGGYRGADAARAAWSLGQYLDLADVTGTPGEVFRQVGCVRADPDGEALSDLPLTAEQRAAIGAMLGAQHERFAWTPQAGYGSAEAAALAFGRGAVRLGADLYLNARAVPQGSGIKLERLEFDRNMARVVAGTARLEAERVVVAAGAATPALLEAMTGRLAPYRRVYRQYPRLSWPPPPGLPVLQAAGFTFRPQSEGVLVVPPALPSDPEGYAPAGGAMMGVRLGVRREVLEQVLDGLETLPVLGWPSLNLGKTVASVRGAWQAATPDGRSAWLEAGAGVFGLIGGEEGFGLGLAAAYEVAAHLASVPELPWV